ncbi:MAG: DUF3368 domain-containing protein [Armatimonadota bacterium]
MTIIVCDTGPILHLAEADALSLLGGAGQILIASAVENELSLLTAAEIKADWLHVVALEPAYADNALTLQASGLLHIGEAQSLALVRQTNATWFLTDDAAARMMATSLGIEVHGSLGIVLWAAAKGYITRSMTECYIDRLAESSLWISPRVLEQAKFSLDLLFDK